MDKLFQNKWSIRVMALIFAVSLYLYVGIQEGNSANNSSVIPSPEASDETQVLDDVPLEVKIDDDHVVSGVPENVTVSLEGKQPVLTPVVRQRNFNVFLDLRDLSEGEHKVEVEHENVPEDLSVYIEPKSVDVSIEARASEEFTVDVDVVNLDSLPLGYEVGEPEVDPEKVTIVSSKEVIDQIAMVKVFIDATDLKESIKNREVPVTVHDIQGHSLNTRVEPEKVSVSLPVDRPSKKVPLSVATTGELPDGLSLSKLEAETVKEIEIFGKQDILDDIENITTDEIDLSKIKESDQYKTDINFPEGTTADDESISVDIELKKEKTFKDISVETSGVDEDDISFKEPDNGKVDITATGEDKAVNKLKKKDIEVSLHLDDAEAGTHEMKLDIDGPEGIHFKSEPKKIKVQVD